MALKDSLTPWTVVPRGKPGRALQGRHRRKRRDESRHVHIGDEQPVDRTNRRSDGESDEHRPAFPTPNWTIICAATTLERLTTAPMERSKSPTTSTTVCINATMLRMATCARMFLRLVPVRKTAGFKIGEYGADHDSPPRVA